MKPLNLDGLNAPQKQAVQFTDGPLLVLAGPGSGKTRVVTYRIANLLQSGIQDWNILALTFTNKAAAEMRDRLETLVPGNRVWLGTFHRFCAWTLRLYIDYLPIERNFTIYDTDDSKKILDTIVDKNSLPFGVDTAKIYSAINWAKNNLILPDDYTVRPGSPLSETVAKYYPLYQKALREANAVDFDDLLIYTAEMLRTIPEIRTQLDQRFRYILVDEYQDTNLAQYAIARALSLDYPNLMVTGDPDQSIYGWRGANIRNILDFEKDFDQVTTIRLEENYRSTGHILAAADSLIQNNRLRKKKKLFTQNQEGKRPIVLTCYNQQEEAETIAQLIKRDLQSGKREPKDIAIFYRMNALSRNLERELRKQKIPFQLIRGVEFFNRKEIKDLLSYFQLAYNPHDTIAFLRVVNLPARGVGRVSLERLADYADEKSISLLQAARSLSRNIKIPRKAAIGLEQFTDLIDKLAALAEQDTDLEILLSTVIKETQYTAEMMASNTEDDKQRLANVQELLSELREFDMRYNAEEQTNSHADTEREDEGPDDRLGRFLELSALVSDTDSMDDSNKVSLMSLHAAKGLEFPVVYIVAVEDNIIPHERSISDKKQLEEERRLLFVGITRAKEDLYLTRTRFREYRGMYTSAILSRFLLELDSNNIELKDQRSLDFTPIFPSLTEEETEDDEDSQDRFLSDYLDQLSEEPEQKTPDHQPIEAPIEKTKRKRKPRASQKGKSQILYAEEGRTVESDEYCAPADSDDTDSYDSEGNRISRGAKKKKGSRPSLAIAGITTAAELFQSKRNAEEKKVSQNWRSALKHGDMVQHKNHGVGQIKEIIGSGSDSIAIIRFLSGKGTIEISLSDRNLKLVGH